MASPAVVGEESRRHQLADVLRDHAHRLRLNRTQARAVRDIVACRTERLGGHLERCPNCGFSRGSYNSCRNRHCPKCQLLKQQLWAEAQEARLLPTLYFQLVFTIPRELHPFFRRAPRLCLAFLFDAVAETLTQVARTKLKATIGFSAVLHTWRQRLAFHPASTAWSLPAGCLRTPHAGSRRRGASSCRSSSSGPSSAESSSPNSNAHSVPGRSSAISPATWHAPAHAQDLEGVRQATTRRTGSRRSIPLPLRPPHRDKEAEQDIRRALEMDADSIDANYVLGLVMKAQGNNQAAVVSFRKTISLIEAGKIQDKSRNEIMHRLAMGHFNELTTGDWNLEKEIWQHVS